MTTKKTSEVDGYQRQCSVSTACLSYNVDLHWVEENVQFFFVFACFSQQMKKDEQVPSHDYLEGGERFTRHAASITKFPFLFINFGNFWLISWR